MLHFVFQNFFFFSQIAFLSGNRKYIVIKFVGKEWRVVLLDMYHEIRVFWAFIYHSIKSLKFSSLLKIPCQKIGNSDSHWLQ